MSELVLIHTNDSHGRFAPGANGAWSPPAVRLRSLLAEHPGAIYLDAGDTVTAGNLGFRMGGEPVLGVLSDLGCAAMCLGNRETHPRKECFPRKVDQARFPLLSANMLAKGSAPLIIRPHVILEHPVGRIGVFGVTVPMFTRKQWSQPLCDYWFDDPFRIAAEQARVLRPQVDVLVALTHIGHRQDLELAQRCPGLDLVIGGHSHTDLDQPALSGGVPVLQARSHAYYAGVARLELSPGRGTLVSWDKVPLRDDIPPPRA
jgi:2',3'-cyclic-nucleotide 2'-phosphodiesterase (5'-nucleotidase family)